MKVGRQAEAREWYEWHLICIAMVWYTKRG